MTELEDRDTVIRLIGGYMVSNAIRAAGSLGLFALADIDGGVSVDDAARAAGIDTDRLTRLIHLLQHAGLVGPSEDRINLTSQGRLLVPGREGSLSNFAQNFTSPLFQRPWDLLEDSLRTGTPGFVLTHQQTVYDYFASDDAANTLFNDAMQEEAAATARPEAMLISLAPDETVVDLGGGDGTFLTTLLQANSSATGIVFDSSAGVANAPHVIERAGVADRCTSQGGDFFTTIPRTGTTYILKSVLQDWDDDHVLQLLRTCAEQIPEGARLIIIGNFIPDTFEDDAAVGYLTDLCMLVISGGRERTIADLRRLLGAAGLPTTSLSQRRIGPLIAVELTNAA